MISFGIAPSSSAHPALGSVSLKRIDRISMTSAFGWRNDPRVFKWCRQAEPLHWDAHEAWFKRQASDPSMSMFLVEHELASVGVCGLTSIDQISRRAEFSLYIDPDRQGHGLGRAALATLLSHGFKNLGLNAIWGEVFDGNPAMKMFNTLGFQHEGTRREFYFRDGRFIDAHLISITAQEWEGQCSQISSPPPSLL